MKCGWKELLSILPLWMRQQVNRIGQDKLQELRLRLGRHPELVFREKAEELDRLVCQEDLTHVINMACHYSPWAATTSAHGYLTAPGGHRIGICGEAVVDERGISTIRRPSSLCIRVARDFPGIAQPLRGVQGSVLIIGIPGAGKTTLLRDLIRQRGMRGSVAVVDERGELFPSGDYFDCGRRTDVLSLCPKGKGVEMVLRTMGPITIAVDEITSQEDCQALLKAGWCGVELIATAHAGSREDLHKRPVYRPLLEAGLFDKLVVMHPDQSWIMERTI